MGMPPPPVISESRRSFQAKDEQITQTVIQLRLKVSNPSVGSRLAGEVEMGFHSVGTPYDPRRTSPHLDSLQVAAGGIVGSQAGRSLWPAPSSRRLATPVLLLPPQPAKYSDRPPDPGDVSAGAARHWRFSWFMNRPGKRLLPASYAFAVKGRAHS